eukprot:CAMPEP_0206498568 /NCGR_PEP_ID=MMETSP0324_2-20121206/51099_1 /ASSEMBLY_ACC=CAM_ASM_000836 /TAXON_ID=2866 /ORGANISM="Crypthecodinium cohnii, Strain Seligo" /LENGTH=64 /DNA_ID=CAMNT_0053984835 /DNA_START=35 /DNA_END=229 /DNA_ORIENTATION=+
MVGTTRAFDYDSIAWAWTAQGKDFKTAMKQCCNEAMDVEEDTMGGDNGVRHANCVSEDGKEQTQ